MNSKPERLQNERGLSLLEILVVLVILSAALVGLSGAGSVAARQLYQARNDMGLWAAVQEQVESLMAAGYDSVTSDAAVVQGYSMSWTVSGTDPKKVLFVVERTNLLNQAVEDTLVLYMADPDS